jgi:hypothetical protein
MGRYFKVRALEIKGRNFFFIFLGYAIKDSVLTDCELAQYNQLACFGDWILSPISIDRASPYLRR